MNKEILEITKKFHDTYEKLASEYTYETREDTKVFDINSNNGKLMYATVNEIVSPILKENKILKENAENNDKVVDKVNWENMLLKKENEQLKKQVDEYKKLGFKYLQDKNNNLENQQKEFIDYMEEKIICYENYQNTNLGEYERNLYFDIYNDILEKYKETIGVSDEN